MVGIDPEEPIHMYTDASKYAAGLLVTQLQKDHETPILYDSFTFTLSEQRYPTYKRELLAIYKFATKYDYLLRDSNLLAVIHTDHKPLTKFLSSGHHDGVYAYWASSLWALCLDIVHIPGKRNIVADTLQAKPARQKRLRRNQTRLNEPN